jgi:hypothetical protein
MTTIGAKTAASTVKRGLSQVRINSGESGTSISSVSIVIGSNPQETMHSEPLKIITEVDGMITTKNQYCIYMYLFFRDKYR